MCISPEIQNSPNFLMLVRPVLCDVLLLNLERTGSQGHSLSISWHLIGRQEKSCPMLAKMGCDTFAKDP